MNANPHRAPHALHPTTAAASAVPADAALETLDSGNLLRGRKIVSILHNGAVYRLQSTKLGKLILTK